MSKVLEPEWTQCQILLREGELRLAQAEKLTAEGRQLISDGEKLYKIAATRELGSQVTIDWETGEVGKEI